MFFSWRFSQTQNLWDPQQRVCGVECQLGVQVQPQPVQCHWHTLAQRDRRHQHHLLHWKWWLFQVHQFVSEYVLLIVCVTKPFCWICWFASEKSGRFCVYVHARMTQWSRLWAAHQNISKAVRQQGWERRVTAVTGKQRWLCPPADLLWVTAGLRGQLGPIGICWCQPRCLPQAGAATMLGPSVPAPSCCQLRDTDLVLEWRVLRNVCAAKASGCT